MKNLAHAQALVPDALVKAGAAKVRTLPLAEPKYIKEKIPTSTGEEHLPAKTLKDWHPEEQPRERLMKYGPAALASSELIAILLRTGTQKASAVELGRQLFHGAGGKLRELGSRSYQELAQIDGIGHVKAVTLVAALELGRRRSMEADVERPLVMGSRAAYDLVAPYMRDLRHEECWAILLNSAKRAIGVERLSSGGIGGTVVDIRTLMALALRYGATSLILAHNHPSRSLNPSEPDITLTRQIVEAGKLMNVPLHDHLIIAGDNYYSFKDAKKL